MGLRYTLKLLDWSSQVRSAGLPKRSQIYRYKIAKYIVQTFFLKFKVFSQRQTCAVVTQIIKTNKIIIGYNS